MVLINVFMSVWYFCKRKLEEKCLFILLYITRPQGITSTIAIAIGLHVVYSVVYKGDINKSVVQKKFFVFVFVLTALNKIVFTNTCLVWTGQSLGEDSLILHWQYKVYLRYTVLCWYAHIAKWKNVLNMGFTNPKSFSNVSKLVHFFCRSIFLISLCMVLWL